MISTHQWAAERMRQYRERNREHRGDRARAAQQFTKSTASHHGTPWTHAEIVALAQMRQEGLSHLEIAIALGRTLLSVNRRASNQEMAVNQ